MGIIISIVIGAVVGWLASIVMGGKGGLLYYIISGVVGSALGSWLAGLIGIGGGGLIWQIIIGVAGTCVLIALVRFVFKK